MASGAGKYGFCDPGSNLGATGKCAQHVWEVHEVDAMNRYPASFAWAHQHAIGGGSNHMLVRLDSLDAEYP